MLSVEAPLVALQGATEAAGAATTAATLGASAPAMAAALPMGGEEVSAMFASAIAAHAAQFISAAGLGVAQRGAFAAAATTSAVTYEVTEAAIAAELAI